MLHQVSLLNADSSTSFKGMKIQPKNVSDAIVNAQPQLKYDVKKQVGAYRGYNNIRLASSLSFGASLSSVISDMRGSLVTCAGPEARSDGEVVGELTKVTPLINEISPELRNVDDAIKTSDILKSEYAKDGTRIITDARLQVKKLNNSSQKPKTLLELAKRWPRPEGTKPNTDIPAEQLIEIAIEPQRYEYKQMRYVGTKEPVYILETKGNNVVVVEDGDNVILTDTGILHKRDKSEPALDIETYKYERHMEKDEATGEDKYVYKENKFRSYAHKVPEDFQIRQKEGGSEGGGTELIIGLEQGRFVPEIIASIEEFQEKIEKGEIVLDKFVPAPDVQNTKIAMLAGGFGSRAEYANASSSRIMHGEEDGSNLTKGCFRTATGLTPMETSFISLHKAGYLDCSKGNFKIGDNIKFYLNDSGKNGGNGSFTVDLYNTMKTDAEEQGKTLLILPNDAMSRIPKALIKLNEKINSGDAAMVMIAKQVPKKNAEGSLGIMEIEDDGTGTGLIKSFAEKPKPVPAQYIDENGNCFANTFQFSVSPEAFKVLNNLEPHIAKFDKKKKEARDWSKTYTPILMAITKYDDIEKIREEIIENTGIIIPANDLREAKNILGNQKIYAIKTDEPWADCGTLNALYHTTCEIARGSFELEDFERAHVIKSVNPATGLIASSPEQKAQIEAKYDIDGQIMVVPKAKPIDGKAVLEKNDYAITRYSSKH